MAVDRDTVTIGTELPVFVRTTGFHNWNRYAAVNDEFVPIHMDDEFVVDGCVAVPVVEAGGAAVNDEFVPIHMDDDAGRAQGFPGAQPASSSMWMGTNSSL